MISEDRSVVALTLLTAIAVMAADQLTKSVARGAASTASQPELFGGFIKLVDVRNSGVAFGQLSGGGVLVVILVAAALTVLVWYFLRHLATPMIWLATGLIIGGAAGNVIDRARDGAVTDFIKFPYWPAFNLADAAITIGVVLLVLLVELDARRSRKEDPTNASSSNA
jgi:signal peptidase II